MTLKTEAQILEKIESLRKLKDESKSSKAREKYMDTIITLKWVFQE